MSLHKRIWLTFLSILFIMVLAGFVDWPNGPDLDLRKFGIDYKKELKIHLGLDLQGGSHLVYECDLSNIEPDSYEEAMAGVRDVIEKRVNTFGVTEPVVQINRTPGHYRIIVELAGIKDVNEAIKMIGQTPSLDFREVKNVESLIKSLDLDEIKNKEEGKEINLEQLKESPQFVMTQLSGRHLKKAQLQFDQQTGQPVIGLEFDAEGKKLFAEITERNVGKPLAIFLDNYVISAPVVNEPIREGQAVITGQFTLEEAKELAMRLNAGALPVPINLIQQQNIGASLGKISVEKSLMAGILGLISVSLFMIFYYRFPGILAVLALGIYGLIVLALFKLIPVTLTLAGVTGFIISIGMAIDANVLIFERIKEELRQGRALDIAIEEGFKSAWPSIKDSNVSSLITCAVFIWFGTSMIKGFGITLGIGILVSMFSAITITRTFLRVISFNKLIRKRLWIFGVSKEVKGLVNKSLSR